MSHPRPLLWGVLILMGLGWGATQPLAKIAVTGGLPPMGMIFWQMVIGAVCLWCLRLWQRRCLPQVTVARLRVWAVIAAIGTLIPNSASYVAIEALPSGIVSILLALVPMFGYPIALSFRLEPFLLRRFLGIALGAIGVLLIVGPSASLPDRALLVFIPLAMVAPLCYGFEGPVIARWGTAGMDAIDVLFGASILGACVALPMALVTGQWVDPTAGTGAPEAALIASALIHIIVYTTYVWMVRQAGAVFAVQVAYLVTVFGVLWAMILLDEEFAVSVWLAMAVMLAGVALVQPRNSTARSRS